MAWFGAVFGEEKDEEQPTYALQYNAELMKSEIPKKPHFVKFYAPW